MARNNPVYQVLVTKGNLAPLAAGSQPSALQVGQVGFFSYVDHTSIDGTNASQARDFYLAVGVDTNGDGTADDVATSAGQYIQGKNITNLTFRCYTPGRPKIVDLTGFKVKCDTEYGIKFSIQNQAAAYNYGYNFPSKTFIVKSNVCIDDCETCPTGDCNDVALQLVNAINADTDKVLTASLIDYTTTPGTPIVVAIADYQAWVDDPANAGLCLGVRVTTIPQALLSYCQINLKYDFPRMTNTVPSLLGGFGPGNGTFTLVQELAYEEGSGYDVRQWEYVAGGWNGKPGVYRVSELVGVPYGDFTFLADPAGKYSTFSITNDLESVGGWLEYKNNLETVIAIPCADTVTRNGFATILDAISARFNLEPMLNDATACVDCVTPNFTDDKTIATDGIA